MKKNRIFKMLVSMVLCLSLVIGYIPISFAQTVQKSNEPKGYVTICVEKFTLGQGYIKEPVKVPFYEGESVAHLVTKLLGDGNYTNTGSVGDTSGTVESGFYLASVKDGFDGSEDTNIPKYILSEIEKGGSEAEYARTEPGFLGEFDYTNQSGWMYCVNNKFPNYGSSVYWPKDGDVIRWQFTTYGLGMDIGGGMDNEFQGAYKPIANKDNLTNVIGEINSSSNKSEILSKPKVKEAYDNACKLLEVVDSSQKDVDLALEQIESALKSKPEAVELKIPVKDAIDQTGSYMHKQTPNPILGTIGGEWTILSLARSGYNVPKEYYEKYYKNVVDEVVSKKGNLHPVKYTEYSRVILGLTAIGKDVTNVGGYNLLEKLADFNKVKKQGINGPIFALIALDTKNYEIPTVEGVSVQTTRDMLIDYILDKEIKKGTDEAGGWALSGDVPDPDITAMALQSLAKYKDVERVKPYIERALNVLSKIQKDNGGYDSWGSLNSESIAQVIVALTALGIDPKTDERFIKGDGNWTLSAIMEFYVDGGGFKHVLDQDVNSMATDQGAYALAAYDRFVDGKNSLYDMTDVKEDKPQISINDAIENSSSYYRERNNNITSWWDMVAATSLGEDISKSPYKVTDYDKNVVNENTSAISDAGNIIGILAQEKDVKNFKEKGNNLAKILANKQQKDGSFGPINYTIWSMLALEMSNQEYNKDLSINYLISKQHEDGGFSLFGGSDVDITGMALLTLSFFKGDEKVDSCINKAINYLDEVQLEDGNFNSWGNENSNSLAVAIMGIVSVGEDINSERWNSAVNALVSYQFQEGKNKGEFRWLSTDNNPNKMATEQCSIALGDAKDNKSIWIEIAKKYDKFEENRNEDPVINAKDTTIEVGNIFNPMEGVTSNDKEDGDITPTYKIDKESSSSLLVSGVAVKSGDFNVIYEAKDSKGNIATKTIKVTIKESTENLKLGVDEDKIKELKEEIKSAVQNDPSEVKQAEVKSLTDGKYLYTVKIPQSKVKRITEDSKKIVIVKLILAKEDIQPVITGAKNISVKLGDKVNLLDGVDAKDKLGVAIGVKVKNENTLPIKDGKVNKEGNFNVEYSAKIGDIETISSIKMNVKPSQEKPSTGGGGGGSVEKPSIQEYKLIGNTRYDTSIKISKKGWSKADNVVIVNSNSIVDALSATPFAKAKNAPILLTEKDKLNNETQKEILRLGAKNVYIIGGTGVISEKIMSELKSVGVRSDRISGDDRYKTSLEIAKRLENISEIALVNGAAGIPDAVSIAPVAANKNMPILLVSSKQGTSVVDDFIKGKNIKASYIIGGENVISNETLNKLPKAKRIGGKDRNETNSMIVENFYTSKTLNSIVVCKNGMKKQDDLIDALSVGVLASKENSPVVIVNNNLDNSQKQVLKYKQPKTIVQVGGGCENAFKEVKDLY